MLFEVFNYILQNNYIHYFIPQTMGLSVKFIGVAVGWSVELKEFWKYDILRQSK